MLSTINQKHVTLSMSNGSVLEGFVAEIKGDFLSLVEHTNDKVVVRIGDISFARLGAPQMYKPTVEYDQEPYQSPPSEDYSMPLPRPTDGPYVRQPELVKGVK